jgi:hypothetical protein
LASLEELKSVCRALKQENSDLKSKISKLEASLIDAKVENSVGAASFMSDNDRIAVRNQIQTYIKRIDDILEESA